MKIYFILGIIIKIVSCVQYNQPCTFSFGTCDWNIGRRWHIISLDTGDKVLIADAESKEDKKTGFTDAIMSSWLHLSPLCSFDIRLTFQYSIDNEDDFIEIYFIQKTRILMTSIGQWKGIKNNNKSLENHQPIWQQGNVTFKAAEEFRIDIEIRHLPDKNNKSIAWFAIDDILIENCPIAIVNTSNTIHHTTETTTLIFRFTKSYSNESDSIFNRSSWKLDDLPDEQPSSSRQTLITLILYLFCALIAFTLLIILIAIILFTYRKHCFPSSMVDQQLGKNKQNNRIGIQIENFERDNQIVKTIDNPVRPCFE